MNIAFFNSEKLRGLFFLAGGISLFFFSLGIAAPLFRLILLVFSLGLVVDGLRKGHVLKLIYSYAGRGHAPVLDRETLQGLIFLVIGIVLFLHAAGFLADLFYIIVSLVALLLIFYGLRETSFFALLSHKIKEYESHKKD